VCKSLGNIFFVLVRDVPLKYYVNYWPVRGFVCNSDGRIFTVKAALCL